jgi:L-fucono-1,5-lactonase
MPVRRMIDAHHHLWDPARRSYPWMEDPALGPIRRRYGLDELRALTAAAGIERTVLVQTVGDVAETEEFLLTAAASEGLIAGVVGWVDLTAGSVDDALAALSDGPAGARLVGVRHQVQDEATPDWLARADVARGIDAVGRAGLVYDLLVRADGVPACIAAADAHPAVQFVLDHAGKPPIATGELDGWRRDIAALARRPNVTVKLSGLVTEAAWQSWSAADLRPVVEHLLVCFGPTRMMFGSDWPVCELAASYGEVFSVAGELLAGLDPAERADVFGGTASRVYGL